MTTVFLTADERDLLRTLLWIEAHRPLPRHDPQAGRQRTDARNSARHRREMARNLYQRIATGGEG